MNGHRNSITNSTECSASWEELPRTNKKPPIIGEGQTENRTEERTEETRQQFQTLYLHQKGPEHDGY